MTGVAKIVQYSRCTFPFTAALLQKSNNTAIPASFRDGKRTENDLLAAAWSNKKDRKVQVDGKMLLIFHCIIFIQYLALTSNGTPCWLLFWTFSEQNICCISDWIKSTVSPPITRVLIFTDCFPQDTSPKPYQFVHPACILNLTEAPISILLFVQAMGKMGVPTCIWKEIIHTCAFHALQYTLYMFTLNFPHQIKEMVCLWNEFKSHNNRKYIAREADSEHFNKA